ncbi:SRPBCC domain-containing protein [Phenylobacterium sp.]|uniref:SRPBCC domain-containing protein n=1 Tax=Phenylobacterium sp. TaxID=1871053 RepID=UPI0025E1E024|nr:SRPBCC domain-containing protein [Phenylobacterium sp.]
MARIDRASRIIGASAQALYRAHLDPAALAAWRAPDGMRGEVHRLDPTQGGGYRMVLVYEGDGQGKTTDKADVFEGTFVELVDDRRIVERVTFESDDPDFAGAMTIATTFTPVAAGTRVDVAISDVPPGITPQDHQAGMDSSLANLAAFVERPA